MPELNSPGSRVVLVGTQRCANDTAAPPIPAVESTMDDLARVLIARCGVRPEQITRVLDSADPMRMGMAVAEAADQATDVLLVHYVGHGFVSVDGELYLATKATDPDGNRLEYNSVPYYSIRKSLLNSMARAIVVILDCCFSGRAISPLSAQEPIDLADVYGGYVLASAGREQAALAPPDQPHTAFTGELITLLDQGDPGGPPLLRMRDVHRTLDRVLYTRGLPRPRKRGSEQIEDLVLAPNAAHGSAPEPLPVSVVSGARAGVRRRKRLLAGLVITMVVLAAMIAVPALWFGIAWSPPASQQRPPALEPNLFPPAKSPNPPASAPEIPPNPPPPDTACAKRRDQAGCELPAHATARAADGRFVTLVRGPEQGLPYRTVLRYEQSSPTSPMRLTGDLHAKVTGDPVLVPDANGKLVAFAAGEFGSLQYSLDVDVSPSAVQWKPMENVSGFEGRPTAAQDSSGKIEVFARGVGGKLWRVSQNVAGKDAWSGARSMGETGIVDDPKMHMDQNGALRVFALGAENRMHTWAQRWQPVESWPENGNPIGKVTLKTSPAVTKGADQLLHLFAIDMGGRLRQVTELPGAPNMWPSDWSYVPELPGSYTGRQLAAANSDGAVAVFTRRADRPDRAVYSFFGGAKPGGAAGSGELTAAMSPMWSVTPDKSGKLVVQGMGSTKPISEFR